MSEFDKAAAEAIVRDRLAPWIQDLDLKVEAVSGDEVVLRVPHDERLSRFGGMVCGQAMMALADTAMIFVVSAVNGGFVEMATTNITTSFFRPIVGKDMIARGRALKTGKLLVFGEVTLYADSDDRPAAHATVTYALPPSR
ncbi:MAG: PaaI family thioesterase [Alphaproteobacteria bacterium]